MKILIIVFLLIVNLSAQVEYSQQNIKSQLLPNFFIDLASYASDDIEKSKIDVFIKVPYSNIQFLKGQTNYRANYSLIISVYDDDDELKLEKLWNEKVTAQSFQQTISQTSYNVSYKSLLIAPGEYRFVCKLEDNESRKFSVFEREINVRAFDKAIDMSDLVIASSFIETEQGPRIIPNISNLVTSQDSSLSFFYEIYTDKAKSVEVSYRINNVENQPLHAEDYQIDLDIGKNEINKTFENMIFSLGDYILEVRLTDAESNTTKVIRKNFASQLFGFPPTIRDLDLAVKQMQYIAAPSEIEDIDTTGTYEEKLRKFKAYWRSLDPSPNSVENETLNEYYRRVEYANNNFKGYFKGWRSDMGMVYITLGAPDQVTRRPYEMDSKPYEVWDYYIINKRFIFVDQTNFGDYRLQNPAYGDWFRYRP